MKGSHGEDRSQACGSTQPGEGSSGSVHLLVQGFEQHSTEAAYDN